MTTSTTWVTRRERSMTGLLEALVEINATEQRIEEGGISIFDERLKGKHGGTRWLSGTPYLWSSFANNAFLFPNQASAVRLIMRFSDELAGCGIHAWSGK